MISLTRPDFLRWLHLFVLSLGLNCGNYSFERLFPVLAPLPDHFTEIRYLCIPVLLVLSWMRRDFNLRHLSNMREALIALGVLGVFIVYGAFRINAPENFLAFYGPLEPYILVFVYGLLAAQVLRNRDYTEDFLRATFVIGLGIAAIYLILEPVFNIGAERAYLNFNMATGYYYSRVFYIGFMISLLLMFKALDKANRKSTILLALSALLFLFCGVTTAMRAAVLLYAVSILALIPLMLALRNYGRLALILTIGLVAYGAGLMISGETLINKQRAFTPFVSNAPVVTMSMEAEDETDCAKRIEALVAETGEHVGKTEYSCKSTVSIRDYDARFRMLLRAINNVPSPWLGNGLGSYFFVDAARPTYPITFYYYPHNIYLALYYETGLIGLGLIGLSILFVLTVCVRIGMSENAQTTAILCLLPVFFLLSGAIAGDFYDARYIWLAPFLIAGMMNHKPKT